MRVLGYQARQYGLLLTVVSIDRRNTPSLMLQRWSVGITYRRRIYFTSKQKSEMWDSWQSGESMSSIGRLFDRDSSSIYPLLSRIGGIRPPDRRRPQFALTLVEREMISRGTTASHSIRSIARELYSGSTSPKERTCLCTLKPN